MRQLLRYATRGHICCITCGVVASKGSCCLSFRKSLCWTKSASKYLRKSSEKETTGPPVMCCKLLPVYDLIVKKKKKRNNTCVFLCTDVGLHAAFTSICNFASNVFYIYRYIFYLFIFSKFHHLFSPSLWKLLTCQAKSKTRQILRGHKNMKKSLKAQQGCSLTEAMEHRCSTSGGGASVTTQPSSS